MAQNGGSYQIPNDDDQDIHEGNNQNNMNQDQDQDLNQRAENEANEEYENEQYDNYGDQDPSKTKIFQGNELKRTNRDGMSMENVPPQN